jgi:hypothetical protein
MLPPLRPVVPMNSPSNGRDTGGRFVAGNRASRGRLGARNKLSERFLADLQRQWRKSGAQVLERVARDEPAALMKCVANLLPREFDTALNVNVSLFAEARSFAEAFRMARDYIGADEPALIESVASTDDVEATDD